MVALTSAIQRRGAEGVAQVLEPLLSKHEVLSSSCSTKKKRKKKRKEIQR
jgi:hypothetical protein